MTSRLPPVDKLMTVRLRAVKEAADNLRGAEAELNRRVVEAIRGGESVAATSRAMGNYIPYRYYAGGFDNRFTHRLWTLFDTDQDKMHGLFHHCRNYRSCPCPACKNRQ